MLFLCWWFRVPQPPIENLNLLRRGDEGVRSKGKIYNPSNNDVRSVSELAVIVTATEVDEVTVCVW